MVVDFIYSLVLFYLNLEILFNNFINRIFKCDFKLKKMIFLNHSDFHLIIGWD
jgi:hypothetical protein